MKKLPPPEATPRRSAGKISRPAVLDASFTCQTGKACWPSRKAARRALKRTQRAQMPTTAVYECPFCGFWHLTSQVQR